ncbi:MAG TPA: MFS transporter [Polyangiaceae bacterium]|nr:MFS transporter [Polyangiaceae bacterium]
MRRRVELLLFSAGWGANHFSALLIVYRRALGFTASQLGLLFGAYALGLVPGLIFAGRESDARGRRALVLPASLAAACASSLLGSSQGFATLIAGRLLYGLAMGAIMSPGSVWLQELSPDGRGPRRATLALSAGFGVGPLISGALAEFAPHPTMLPYALHTALIIGSWLGARSVPETAQKKRPIDLRPRARNLATVRLLLRQLPVAPWAFGLAAVTLVILPGILRAQVARPVLYSACVIAVTLAAGVAMQPLLGRVGRRPDLVGLGLGALGVVLGAYAVGVRSPSLVFVVAVLVGCGYGLVMTSGLREIAERVEARERGSAVGVYYVLTYVGFALPFVHALVAKSWGDVATLEATSVTVGLCLALRALISRGGQVADGARRD